jgi:hypothetical protein
VAVVVVASEMDQLGVQVDQVLLYYDIQKPLEMLWSMVEVRQSNKTTPTPIIHLQAPGPYSFKYSN